MVKGSWTVEGPVGKSRFVDEAPPADATTPSSHAQGRLGPSHRAEICTNLVCCAASRAKESTPMGQTVTQIPQPMQELFALVIGSCRSA
jgi:hypothetical protein